MTTYEAGARVRTRAQAENGHTRLPRYLQNRSGRVICVLGDFTFADEAAVRPGDAPLQRLYTVEFEECGYAVRADLFESYMESDV